MISLRYAIQLFAMAMITKEHGALFFNEKLHEKMGTFFVIPAL